MIKELFADRGIHAIVDGQFGSTGKGALGQWLAEQADEDGVAFHAAITNAGPNSGHTFYDAYGDKHVLKQLPTFAVANALMGNLCDAVLSAGAVIDPQILEAEALRYPNLSIYVHPNAAVVTEHDKLMESDGTIRDIASTQQGTGAALARKVYRDPTAIWKKYIKKMPINVHTGVAEIAPYERYMLEVSQGFSLGIHSRFYPHVTSRECTVIQGMADARIPCSALERVYMATRVYPIRVGNLGSHSSGDWYPDQQELSWQDLGLEPELTTVTKRPRRIATWSWEQFRDAVRVNEPDFVLVNFLNYMKPNTQQDFLTDLREWRDQRGMDFDIIEGYGPSEFRMTRES